MRVDYNFRQSKFRELVTGAILEMLTHLPEIERKIFVLNHYCGYPPKEIAEVLRRSPFEIHASLDGINALLYKRTRILLESTRTN
jgi:DNA-directed RNA polymerase specialized sigma24 family protein